MANHRPGFFDEVRAEERRTLPVYCEACRAVEEDIRTRVSRRRMMEDLASAFAFVGLLSWLRSMGYSDNAIGWAMHRLGLYNGD